MLFQHGESSHIKIEKIFRYFFKNVIINFFWLNGKWQGMQFACMENTPLMDELLNPETDERLVLYCTGMFDHSCVMRAWFNGA